MNMGSTVTTISTRFAAFSKPTPTRRKGDPMTKSIQLKSLALAVVLVMTGISSSFAASAPTMQEKMACRSDAQTFCSQFIGKPGEMLACLHDNKTRISPSCRQVVDAHGG
jgi:Cysteine rich repeat